MFAPLAEPAVNEMFAKPLPALAESDVGAPGAAAEIVMPHEESLFDNQLPVDALKVFTART